MSLQRPTTMQFGFLGAKPRYVDKYARVIKGLDLNVSALGTKEMTSDHITRSDVLQYLPATSNFFLPSLMGKASLEVEEILNRKMSMVSPVNSDKDSSHTTGYKQRGLIFYLLSNNGAFTFANFQYHLRKKDYPGYLRLMGQCSGIIWDSSPCYPSPELFTRGFVSVLRGLIGKVPDAEDPTLTPLLNAFFRQYFSIDSRKELQENLEYSLRELIPVHVPQLYMYSQSDNLVLPQDTELLIQDQAKLYVNTVDAYKQGSMMYNEQVKVLEELFTHQPYKKEYVFNAQKRLDAQRPEIRTTLGKLTTSHTNNLFVRDFVDSKHVDHLRAYPEEYTKLIQAFMEYAVRD